ncbi:trypsin-like peptidase domain-containing protein [Sinomonas sp. JGH33]|uniref:Trypsin-like peptidase domain-containing protein n=1 Tax=Sinomonas terricola TaxID=3110330 RepID=A0ABU5T0G4_9MICC|nr:trypsin-like peptidase domain-containing protein [Sinomonas sp. JGH33]MEA5453136.1 trypsin-like peptidase domain-containing protein [Sinomonas sp. JGH33]
MSETPESPDRGRADEGANSPERPTVAPSDESTPTQPTQVRSEADATPTAPISGPSQPPSSEPQAQPQAHAAPAAPSLTPTQQQTQPQPRFGQYAQPSQPQRPPQSGPQAPQYGQSAPQYGQPGPMYGQHAPQYGQQGPTYGQPAPGQPNSPYGQPPQGGTSFAPPTSARPRDPRRWGTGVLVGGMLIAGLIGGGVAVGGYSLLSPRTAAVGTAQNSPVIVNNQESVNAVTAAAAKASPSVVTIGVTSGSSSGTGSGVVLDDNGHILTNTHVVTLDGSVASPTIQVRTSDGSVYPAAVVGTDPLSDLAVIQVKGAKLTPITFGDSSKLNVGDTAIAIGAPLGLDSTVTDGIVSTLNRTISVASSAPPQGGDSQQGDGGQGFQFAPPNGQSQRSQAQSTVSLNVIQTDAAINPGNSGGALVNTKGELVGINVAIASTGSSSSSSGQSGNIGVGFSIPANYAHRIAQEIIASGKATHGQLGVSVQPAAPGGSSNSAFSVGAQVADVTSGSPADKAGIKKGDVITHFGDYAIGDASELTAAVRQQAPGSTVKVTLTRNGQSVSVDVTVGSASS